MTSAKILDADKIELQSQYFQETEVSINVSVIYRHAIVEFNGADNFEDNPSIISEFFSQLVLIVNMIDILRSLYSS